VRSGLKACDVPQRFVSTSGPTQGMGHQAINDGAPRTQRRGLPQSFQRRVVPSLENSNLSGKKHRWEEVWLDLKSLRPPCERLIIFAAEIVMSSETTVGDR
jgi:hypothetical protein